MSTNHDHDFDFLAQCESPYKYQWYTVNPKEISEQAFWCTKSFGSVVRPEKDDNFDVLIKTLTMVTEKMMRAQTEHKESQSTRKVLNENKLVALSIEKLLLKQKSFWLVSKIYCTAAIQATYS